MRRPASSSALRQVLDYYHTRLKENPAALAYLQKRGIGSEEAIATFRLGFVDRTLGLRLPQANRREGAAIRERLTRLGILRETGLLDPGLDLGCADDARIAIEQVLPEVAEELLGGDALEREVIEVAPEEGVDALTAELAVEEGEQQAAFLVRSGPRDGGIAIALIDRE